MVQYLVEELKMEVGEIIDKGERGIGNYACCQPKCGKTGLSRPLQAFPKLTMPLAGT